MTQTANSKPEMLTVRQAAQRKVLPERALRRLVAQNKIPTVRSGKTQYINFTALVEQLNNGQGDIWR
jgi:excisionase family DNA binding protein